MSSLGRRLAHRYLFPSVEAGWAAGFSLVGWVLQLDRRVRWWEPEDGRQAVIVATHPDDETLGAGGVAALHAQAGDRVTVVVVTDGGASRAGGLTREETARRRKVEVTEAVSVLGVDDLIWTGLPEGQWDATEARASLEPTLADAEVVYAPSCVDFHPEHVRVAHLVAKLVRPDQTVRVCELGVPLTPLLVNVVADIREVAALKARALRAFVTQVGAVAPPQRLARYQARLYGRPAVEVFWELPAPAYARVMAAGGWHRGASPFFGVRERPVSDPLSMLVGLRARAALRAVAESAMRSRVPA